MFKYTIRRIISAIPVLFGVLLVAFALARIIPGNPCRSMLGQRATPEGCAKFDHNHGLDRPIFIQFTFYVQDLAQGDFTRDGCSD